VGKSGGRWEKGKQLGASRQVPGAIGVNILARKYSQTHTRTHSNTAQVYFELFMVKFMAEFLT